MTGSTESEPASTDCANEINEMNTARHRVYQLLSSLFARELDWPMVKELNSQRARDFWQQLATQPEFETHTNVIMTVIAGLKTDEDLLELAADYCGLFLVGTHNSASPYASLYMGDKNATLFGEQHQKIIGFLQQNKLQLQSDFAEPADHIAVILAYAGHLALNGTPQKQLDFLQTYLANWLSEFVMKVKETDQGYYYSALAQLTEAWITSEVEWLKLP